MNVINKLVYSNIEPTQKEVGWITYNYDNKLLDLKFYTPDGWESINNDISKQSDWTEKDSNKESFIKNKPEIIQRTLQQFVLGDIIPLGVTAYCQETGDIVIGNGSNSFLELTNRLTVYVSNSSIIDNKRIPVKRIYASSDSEGVGYIEIYLYDGSMYTIPSNSVMLESYCTKGVPYKINMMEDGIPSYSIITYFNDNINGREGLISLNYNTPVERYNIAGLDNCHIDIYSSMFTFNLNPHSSIMYEIEF